MKERFIHIYDKKNPRPAITLAYVIEDIDASHIVSLGVSFTAPTDFYSKRLGRSISLNRMHTHPLQIRIDRSGEPLRVHHIISMFHAVLIAGVEHWELEGTPLRPSRFKARRQIELIGPDGRVMNVGMDSTPQPEKSSPEQIHRPLGWLSTIPRWARPFLSGRL